MGAGAFIGISIRLRRKTLSRSRHRHNNHRSAAGSRSYEESGVPASIGLLKYRSHLEGAPAQSRMARYGRRSGFQPRQERNLLVLVPLKIA